MERPLRTTSISYREDSWKSVDTVQVHCRIPPQRTGVDKHTEICKYSGAVYLTQAHMSGYRFFESRLYHMRVDVEQLVTERQQLIDKLINIST